VHFRREKYIPKGGPDGGNGGRGGHVILRGNRQLWTLLHLKYHKHVIAGNGHGGESALRTGAQGKDKVLEVPLGTLARDALNSELITEIIEDGQEAIIVPGGRGGYGNDHFKSATLQAPRFAQPGEPGEERQIILELKVLADVGLVGLPNAGKSTFLSAVSAAKPKIADYPFTTLVPHLGVVSYHDSKSFIIADIPGIIEGAADGKGLGVRFLRHIERNSILLFMIPSDSQNIRKEFEILLNELSRYNPELLDKKRVLAITKSDLLDEELKTEIMREIPAEYKPMLISSITGDGIAGLLDILWKHLSD
jgi:GTP-binding protein